MAALVPKSSAERSKDVTKAWTARGVVPEDKAAASSCTAS